MTRAENYCHNFDERLPPPVRKTQEKKYHLKPEDIAEIRRLRTLDPQVALLQMWESNQ